MFPISMLKFTDKFEFNKGISINEGGATINGGLTVNPGTMSYINGGLTVQNGGIKTENGWSDIKGLKVYDNFSLHGIIADLGLGFNARSGKGGGNDWTCNKF